MKIWLILLGAIVAEVIATTALRGSDGLRKLGPTVVMIVGYGVSFYLLSLTLKTIPMGVAYAVWSGVGLVLIALAGRIVFGQRLDAPALIGMALIMAGVAVINLFSRSVAH